MNQYRGFLVVQSLPLLWSCQFRRQLWCHGELQFNNIARVWSKGWRDISYYRGNTIRECVCRNIQGKALYGWPTGSKWCGYCYRVGLSRPQGSKWTQLWLHRCGNTTRGRSPFDGRRISCYWRTRWRSREDHHDSGCWSCIGWTAHRFLWKHKKCITVV